jgi:hypothetical protein
MLENCAYKVVYLKKWGGAIVKLPFGGCFKKNTPSLGLEK